MATRWYLTTETQAKTNAYQAGWNDTASALRRVAKTSDQSPTSGAQTYNSAAEVAGSAVYVCLFQFYTLPLAGGQTIDASGSTFTARFLCLESASFANDFLRFRVRVFDSSDSVKVDVLSGFSGATEFEVGTISDITAYVNRYTTSYTLTQIAIDEGDYLVFEIGYYANNTKTTSYEGGIAYGYHSGDADAGANETDTNGSTYNAWIECAKTLTFSSGLTNTDRTPTIGAASITGVGPVQGIGIFVPTEVDV